MVERIEFGLPVAGEKARKADEFVTKSQIVAGDNVEITTDDNGDLLINATTDGGGIADGTVNHSTLRWDGTDWVENTKVQTHDSSMTVKYSSTIYAGISASLSSAALNGQLGSNNTFYIGITGLKFINLVNGGVARFSVDLQGNIVSSPLAAVGEIRPVFADSTGKLVTYASNYGRILIMPVAPTSDSTIIYETSAWAGNANNVYQVDVNVGILEKDSGSVETNVGIVQKLEIYDSLISDYREIGASHCLVYTTPGGTDYKLLNRSLQGSCIVKVPSSPNNVFKIRVTLPNHGGGGTGEITGGYIHYRRIE